MRKKTDEEFKVQVYELVKNDYTFLEPYKDARTPITVRHNACGAEYKVTPDNFLRGKRCSHCSHVRNKNRRTMTNKINAELSKHGEHLVTPFENTKTMMLIRCDRCGLKFKRSYDAYKNHKECPFCSNDKVKVPWDTPTFSWYVNHITGGQYELMSDYHSVGVNVKIMHKQCGHIYEVLPLNFLKGDRCPYEKYQRVARTQNMGNEEFQRRVKELVGEEYEPVGQYATARKPILMKHNKCGNIWETTPDNFLRGHGCPICKESNGEKAVAKYLAAHNITFIRQKKFEGCRIKYMLPFDFYLPKQNMCIEYDGEQHFHPIRFFGGEEKFKYTHYRDLYKNRFCKEHQIKLIRIKYTEDVNNVLEQVL